MTTPVKRQKRVMGDIVKIPLDNGFHSYAHVLEDTYLAFYDYRTREDIPVEEIVKRPVIFYVAVMKYAFTKKHFISVGNVPLDGLLLKPPPQFIQDPINRKIFRIYENGKMRSATYEECKDLECAAVWDPDHVQDRLNDYYAGRKNKWVESMKIKLDS